MSKPDLTSKPEPDEVLYDLASLDKTVLERLTIDAIREHRRLLETDELLHEEWQRAEADPSIPRQHLETLRAQCFEKQMFTAAQQEMLAHMLDLLGYVPEVPPEEVASVTPDR